MAHAILDDTGLVIALFYEAPPNEAEEVPPGVVCGWRKVDGVFHPPTPCIDSIKELRIDQINGHYASMKSATPGVPYAAKHDEALEVARMVDDGHNPNDLPIEDQQIMFPRLSASVGIEADNLADAATLILNRYTEHAKREGALERARLMGKNQVNKATSLAEVNAAFSEAIQALEAANELGRMAKGTGQTDGDN